MDPLPLEFQRQMRQKYQDNPEVLRLLQEIKRIRTRYIGQELTYLSPIAERTGRRVKILVHRLNEDAAHQVVSEGVKELLEEIETWKLVPISRMRRIPGRILRLLDMAGYRTISELLQAAETDLLDVPGIRYRDLVRLEYALDSLRGHH